MIGAWTWTRLRLARCGRPLPAWAAPDTTSRWAASGGDVELAQLADLVADLAFNPAGRTTASQADSAWRLAGSALRKAQNGSLRDRIVRSALSPQLDEPPAAASGQHRPISVLPGA